MGSHISRRAAIGAVGAAALTAALPAFAQSAPVKILVGFPPGGSADATARLLSIAPSAGPLATPLKQVGWRLSPRLVGLLNKKGLQAIEKEIVGDRILYR